MKSKILNKIRNEVYMFKNKALKNKEIKTVRANIEKA